VVTGQAVFRLARRADIEAIAGLLADDPLGATREIAGADLDSYERAFDAVAADPRNLLIVADIGGRVAGTLQLTFIPGLSYAGGERAQIEAVRVARQWRGQGLGGQMLRWAIDQARIRGCRLVQLTTNLQRLDALRFYESLGFTASHAGMKLDLQDG
jgi:GNAT superfamily N-acetyltransferase